MRASVHGLDIYILLVGLILLISGCRIRVASDDASPTGVFRRGAKYRGIVIGTGAILLALRELLGG